MKKLSWLIVCLMTIVLASCGNLYSVTANYDVCYPDGTRNYNDTIVVTSVGMPSVMCYSFGGTNYISATENGVTTFGEKTISKLAHFMASTAPMRLNNYKVIGSKKKDKKKYYDEVY